MAEDAEFIEAIEQAGLGFMGPSSRVVRRAGAKDEAKKLARSLGNAVIPGVDDVSARALLRARRRTARRSRRSRRSTGSPSRWDAKTALEENAEALLQAGYAKTVELVTIAELQAAGAELLRARSGASTRATASASSTSAAAAARASAWSRSPSEVAAAVMDVLRRVEGASRPARTGTS